MHTLLIARLTRYTSFVALLGLGGLMYGCGSSDSGTPPNANPAGYYSQGSLSVSDGTITDNNALQAMVYNDRIMMMSVANGLLYDGTMTVTPNSNSFMATFTIYTHGENPVTATASGTITQGSSITGTLTGAGVGDGTFSLTYSTVNNSTAALSRIVTTVSNPGWGSPVGGSIDNLVIDIDAAGNAIDDLATTTGIYDNCGFNGVFTPIAGTNLYAATFTLNTCDFSATVEGSYTGLATTQSLADDTLVFAITHASDTFAAYGDFH